MNSSSSSSAYHSYAMSLPPPYPSDCLNSERSSVASHQIAVTANVNANDRNRGQLQEPISTVTLPPPAYSELIKEPNIFLINPNHQTKPS